MALAPHEFNARFWSVIAATFLGFLGIGSVLPALAPHGAAEIVVRVDGVTVWRKAAPATG